MLETNFAGLSSTMDYIEAWATQYNVEIKTIDTNRWIVFDAQVNVFLDTETEVARFREIVASQFVFTNLFERKHKNRKH